MKQTLGRFVVEDPVKAAYLRTSLLFGLSVVVTWIPSSVNRIRGLSHSDTPFGYNVATATVLPLQGVWNAVIFFVTSWRVLRAEVTDWRWRKRGGVRPGTAEGVEGRVSGAGSRGERRAERSDERKDSWDFADIGQPGDVGSDVELKRVSALSDGSMV